MTGPMPAGWYPDPATGQQRYWNGAAWADGAIGNVDVPANGADTKKLSTQVKVLAGVTAVGAILAVANARSHDGSADAEATGPVASTATPAAPDPLKYMPGDGVWQKYWGVWESDPAPAQCFWSVVAQDPYSPAETLDHGQAAPGETVRVNLQPVSGREVKFQTHGCGAWRLVD